MLAHMDAEAIAKTRRRDSLISIPGRAAPWMKGESRHTLKVVEIRVDCDQDALELRVEAAGGRPPRWRGPVSTGGSIIRRTCADRGLTLT
jgi:phosphoribosyl-AMP cyclohydrolase